MIDRIKLAEAMGWKRLGGEWDLKGDPPAWEGPNTIDGFDDLPDPFTDANDDYAVLEHYRNKTKPGGGTYKSDIHSLIEWMRSVDYQIGDYARAALKVIE